MTAFTDDDARRLRELLAKATPGPWSDLGTRTVWSRVNHDDELAVALCHTNRDVTAIAAMRNSLEALLDERDGFIKALADLNDGCLELERERDRLREELRALRGK